MSTWSVREYTKGDAAMIAAWHRGHGGGAGPFPFALLPPVGIVIEHEEAPVAACWLYMAVGVGLCWLELPVSRPGLPLREAREAFRLGIAALEQIAQTHDYRVMMAHTTLSIARALRGFGFQPESGTKITLHKILSHG